VDENYTFLTQEEILDIRRSAVDDEILTDEVVKLEDQPVIYYLYALKYPKEDEVVYNPYISVYSENLDYLEKVIKTKEDYITYNMEFAVAVFNASGYKASASNIDKLWFDDRQFANSVLSVNLDDVTMKKEMFTILRGNFAINIVLGYNTPEDREELMTFLDTIKIQK
ncbi:MAG: hypothetical protein JXQ23_12920, partial [Clostridia bacterium]|nr:hypothetical protein [Clostridia bacterium]